MKKLLCLLACLAFVACGGNGEQSETQQSAAETQEATAQTQEATADEIVVADMMVESGTYPVACGCSIESVGHCGNYIEVAGIHVPIANGEAMELGAMEWCGQSEVTVMAAGEIKDGEFIATELVVQ